MLQNSEDWHTIYCVAYSWHSLYCLVLYIAFAKRNGVFARVIPSAPNLRLTYCIPVNLMLQCSEYCLYSWRMSWKFIPSQILDTLPIALCSPLHLRKEPECPYALYQLHLSFWATMLRHLKRWLEVSPHKLWMCKADTYFNTVTAIWRTVDLTLHLILPWDEFYQVMLKKLLPYKSHVQYNKISNFITVNIEDIGYLYWFQRWSHKSAATFSAKKPCP